MKGKSPAVSKRRNDLFILAVIILSVLTVALLLGTLFSHFSQGGNNNKAKENAAALLSKGFNCTADVSFSGNDYEVKLQKPTSGDCTMTFVKPAVLNTLSFEQSDDGVKVKFGTLEAAVDPSSIPQSSIFSAVIGVFDACLKSGVNAKTHGQDVNLSGSTPVGAFTMTLGGDMTPKSLSIPGIKMNATFKDFAFDK
jgi:hypothetical protein